jgi:TAT-translocated FGD2 family F420-dependent dehydrogenase
MDEAVSRRDVLRGGVRYAGLSGALLAAGGLGTSWAAEQEPARGPSGGAPGTRTPTLGFVLTSEQFTGPALADLAVGAEEAGFDAVWTSDHFLPWQDNQGHAGNAWVLLGALTQRTKRVTLGTGVTCPIYRYHPAVVAQAFASLSYYAPGRIFLGCGKGEALNEYAATGSWDKHADRTARWVESMDIIRRLWSGEWVDHDGRWYRVHGKLYDKPAATIPLYVAAAGTQSTRIAGRVGDGWVCGAKDALDAKKQAAFRAGVAESGRDVGRVPVIVEQWVVVGGKKEAEEAASQWRFVPQGFTKYFYDPDPRDIERRAEREVPLESVYADWPVSEDPEVHVNAITKLRDAGVTQVFVHSGQRDQRRVLAFYGREVLPRLRSSARAVG